MVRARDVRSRSQSPVAESAGNHRADGGLPSADLLALSALGADATAKTGHSLGEVAAKAAAALAAWTDEQAVRRIYAEVYGPRRDHACSACGGTGDGYSQRDAMCSACWVEHGQDGEACRRGCGCHDAVPLCAVCDGAGRISDVMPARDALADALQIETYYRSHFKGSRYHATQLYKAAEAGVRAESGIVYGGGWYLPHVTAADAARHAFRAVPGLRGDA